jgi:hypothetical protein
MAGVRRVVVGWRCALAAPLILFPGAARAAEAGGDPILVYAVCAGFLVLLAILLAGLRALQRGFADPLVDFAREAGARPSAAERIEALKLLHASPAGLPEGTVRAVLSFILVTGGVLVLMFQKKLGLDGAGDFAGILGTVIGFYFGARGGDGASRARPLAPAASPPDASEPAPPPAAATPDADAPTDEALAALRDRLFRAHALARVAADANSGASVLNGAGAALAAAGSALAGVPPLLGGKAGPADRKEAARHLGDALGALDEVRLPGFLGGAIATLRRASAALGGAAPPAAGPAGLAGTLLLSGIAFVGDHVAFERWRDAVLQRPFAPMPSARDLDGTLALAALDAAPALRDAVRAAGHAGDPGFSLRLVGTLMEAGADGKLLPSADIAKRLVGAGDLLPNGFADEGHAAEAVEQCRQGIVFQAALRALPPRVPVGAEGNEVDLPGLLSAIPALRENRFAADAIDGIASLAATLARQTLLSKSDLAKALGEALARGAEIAATRVQTPEEA